ncbi:MAG: GNAT family N-acetyltransferase [Proteobacteria bacterium]|nr:GNAT family N-acetyltransferase [Pseudomonadota bacterium]
MIRVEPVSPANFSRALPLIAQYQRFYGKTPDAAANRRFFSRFLRNKRRGMQLLARGDDGRPLGFATLYFYYSSLSAEPVCTLNDLFTVREARGKGVGRALMERCVHVARRRGLPRLEWQTHVHNRRSQRFYSKFPASSDVWRSYSLDV